MNNTFHISLPCKNIEETIKYYTENLALTIGRKTSKWVDVNLFGNQVTFVLSESFTFKYPTYSLGNDKIPSFHFGVILDNEKWDKVYQIINNTETEITIKKTFLKNKKGEHHSFFVKDPNDYIIEFKTFSKYEETFLT